MLTVSVQRATSISLLPCVERLPVSHGKAFVLYATTMQWPQEKMTDFIKSYREKFILWDI